MRGLYVQCTHTNDQLQTLGTDTTETHEPPKTCTPNGGSRDMKL